MEYPTFKITQSDTWEAFQKATGREVFCHKLESGGHALFIKFKLALGRCRLLGMGVDFTAFTEVDFSRLNNEARKMRCTHIRCEGYCGEIPVSFNVSEVKKSYLPIRTIKLDLSLSTEGLLSGMKRKGRYNINLAEKAGVQVKYLTGADNGEDLRAAVLEFYSILKETCARDKFSVHPKEYYEKMLSELKGDGLLYLAKVDGRTIGGIIVAYGKDEAVYYYGASSNESRNLMAPYLLQWRAIRDAKGSGKKMYDFMGVAEPRVSGAETSFEQGMSAKDVTFDKSDPLYGVSEFKQKFGGYLYSFNKPLDIIVSPFFYRLYNFAKRFTR